MLVPHDYQNKAKELLEKTPKMYFAMDTGTGKTITSLLCASVKNKDTLLVAELGEIERNRNFEKEIENFFSSKFDFTSLRKKDLGPKYKKQVFAINPEMLIKQDLKTIAKVVDTLIVDESTLAKETTSKRFKALLKISKEIKNVILLSGTPMMNSGRELLAPLMLLDHPLAKLEDTEAGSKKTFGKIFAGGHYKQIKSTKGEPAWKVKKFWFRYNVWWDKGASNIELLRYLVNDSFYFVKKDDTGIFKNKSRTIKKIPMTLEWINESQEAWDEYLTELKKDKNNWQTTYSAFEEKEISKIDNVTELKGLIEKGKMYQVNSLHKARQVIKDIKSGEFGSQRIIVFTYFVATYEMLIEEFKKAGISFGVFENGAEWKKGTEQVLLGRIKAHGKGGNYPEASVTLMIDMSPVPAENIQCENRADRPQQKNNMLVRYYLADGMGGQNIDNHIRRMNKQKQARINKFMNEPDLEIVKAQLLEIKEKYGEEIHKKLSTLIGSAGVV